MKNESIFDEFAKSSEKRISAQLMLEAIKIRKSSDPWSEKHWTEIEQDTRRQALATEGEEAAWEVIVRRARCESASA